MRCAPIQPRKHLSPDNSYLFSEDGKRMTEGDDCANGRFIRAAEFGQRWEVK